jgi:hypothetical protein
MNARRMVARQLQIIVSSLSQEGGVRDE